MIGAAVYLESVENLDSPIFCPGVADFFYSHIKEDWFIAVIAEANQSGCFSMEVHFLHSFVEGLEEGIQFSVFPSGGGKNETSILFQKLGSGLLSAMEFN